MAVFLVTRIAQKNPEIRGRKLYLTRIGLWSLDIKYARKFYKRSEAVKAAGDDATVEAA